MSRLFHSFRDASLFAKQQSVNSKTLHSIKRNENAWVVLSKYEKYAQNPIKKESGLNARIDVLEKRLELLETLQKEIEQKRKERKAQRKKRKALARSNYLKERKEEYSQLPTDILERYAKQYLNNTLEKEIVLDEEELTILKEILEPHIKKLEGQIEKEKHETEEKHFNERKEYYLSLPEEELDRLWANSDQLKGRERSLLRSILRQVKGLDELMSIQKIPYFCSTCGLQKEVCCCGERTWW